MIWLDPGTLAAIHVVFTMVSAVALHQVVRASERIPARQRLSAGVRRIYRWRDK